MPSSQESEKNRASAKNRDYAIAPDEYGTVIFHRADCPQVRALADRGVPVMTMLGCEGAFPEGSRYHSCLDHD